jgi:hypothetical protein
MNGKLFSVSMMKSHLTTMATQGSMEIFEESICTGLSEEPGDFRPEVNKNGSTNDPTAPRKNL